MLDDDLPGETPQSLKICVYRFVQEGLTNAFRHAGGAGQAVAARAGPLLEVRVSDHGPGLPADIRAGGGLGMAGMRARIEGAGGKLEISSTCGQGTHLVATFDVAGTRHAEVDTR
jgi:signal transduction histidine kinase